MATEGSFRLAMFVLLFLTMCVGVYHRVRAHSGERFDRRQEGLALAIALRLAGLGAWLGIFAYLINPEWMRWSQMPLPDAVRWLGVPLGIAGMALMYWTMTNLGKNLTDTVATRTDATLVTSGPYRYVRHPFYVTAGLALLAAALLSANAAIGACGLVVVLLLAARTPKEEQKLLEKFGEPYRQYRATTGALVPRWPSRRAH